MSDPTRIPIALSDASRELAAREPGVRLIGFGGAHLEAAGAMLAGDYHQFSVTGLTVMLSEDHSAPIVHVQKRTEHASRRSRQTTSSVSRGRTSRRAA